MNRGDEIQLVKRASLSDTEMETIREIWNNEYPESLYNTKEEFKKYLATMETATHYLACNANDTLCGWLCTFMRDNTLWFVLLVHGNAQRKGIGSQLIHRCQQDNYELTGWIIDRNKLKKRNGETYPSPMRFYEKLQFHVTEEYKHLPIMVTRKILWKSESKLNS